MIAQAATVASAASTPSYPSYPPPKPTRSITRVTEASEAGSPGAVPSESHRAGGRPSSSLDHRSFSVEKTPCDSPEQDFRFAGQPSTRQALLAVIFDLNLTDKQLERFTACGSDAWVQRNAGDGSLRVTCKTCKLRFCPACRLRHARKTKATIARALATAPVGDWRFITLTARHSRLPLTEQLANIRAAFRRLRQRKSWKSRVTGGIAVIEINWNAKTGQWHPHLHIVASGTYYPQAELSKAWLSCTRTSCIVDIRSIWKIETAVDYIAKYISKSPLGAFTDQPEPLIEFVTATARGHLLIPFGTGKTCEPEVATTPEPGEWEPLCSLAVAITRAKLGIPFYVELLESLNPRQPDRESSPLPPAEATGFP